MSVKTSIAAGVLVGGLVCSVGVAQAETPQVQGASVKSQTIPNPEKLARSGEYLAQMRLTLKTVLAKLEEARASKDVVKLNCVNEKLTNIKGLLRISEQADITLQEAVAKAEDQAADHEYSKVVIAKQKIDQLRAEAEQCVGMLAFETGPTEVVVQEPIDLPRLDPTLPALPPRSIVVRPPPASPID